MVDLFLNHSPIFVADEFALGLSILMFMGALTAAVSEKASALSQSVAPRRRRDHIGGRS
jgi:hypothetical protein